MTIAAGARLDAVQVTSAGVVRARRTFTAASGGTVTRSGARSLIDGRSMLRIESGTYAGWWVLATQVSIV